MHAIGLFAGALTGFQSSKSGSGSQWAPSKGSASVQGSSGAGTFPK